MYGVLLHQTYNYVRVYSGDSFWLKSYVSIVQGSHIQTYAVIQVVVIL